MDKFEQKDLLASEAQISDELVTEGQSVQVSEELSDEALEAVAGGAGSWIAGGKGGGKWYVLNENWCD